MSAPSVALDDVTAVDRTPSTWTVRGFHDARRVTGRENGVTGHRIRADLCRLVVCGRTRGRRGLVVGQRIALAVPSDIAIQNPQLYPAAATASPGCSSSRMRHRADSTSAGSSPSRVRRRCRSSRRRRQATCEMWLLTGRPVSVGDGRVRAGSATAPTIVQALTGPGCTDRAGRRSGCTSGTRGRSDFSGTLPYASELFGVYQPLAGWLGRQAVDRAARVRTRSGDGSPEDVDRVRAGPGKDGSPVAAVGMYVRRRPLATFMRAGLRGGCRRSG